MKQRTEVEVLQRISERTDKDFFGFEVSYYYEALPWEKAKVYFKEEYWPELEKEWKLKTPEDWKKQAIYYLSFAWEKALGERGLSAGRSISHYIAWLWLMGEDGWDDIEDYTEYGKPELRRICKHLGVDYLQYEGERNNDE